MNNQGEASQPQAQFSQIQHPTFVAPLSQQSQHAVQTRGNPSTLNLDDIFGDCFFTPEGDQIFLSENEVPIQPSGEAVISMNASKPILQNGTEQYIPVPNAGGIVTTGLDQPEATRATTMGPANDKLQERKIAPMTAPPQQRHHLQYAIVSAGGKKKGTTAPSLAASGSTRDRKMSDQQKSERR
jgi:hypothetical protein